MSHPNEDFLKRFLGENKISPAQQKAMLRKKRMADYFDKVNNPKPNVLKEENKKEILAATEKIFYRAKESSILTEAKKQTWLEKKTPFGIFFFNPEQQVWMNSLGAIKKNFNEFFAADGYESTGDGPATRPIPPSPPSPISLVRVLSFSDEGSHLAGYAEDGEQNSYINVYSLDYGASVTPTLQHTVTLGGITFDGSTGQKCLVSEDGGYLILTLSDIRRVYFFDATSDTLLQTITEDDLQFGSLVAADKDFYGLAISSTSPSRGPSIYDVRNNCYEVSSKIHYYKRNYNSTQAQKFVKIHTNGAWTYAHKTGVDGPTVRSINEFCQPYSVAVFVQPNVFQDTIVARCSDLVCRGYNWSQSVIALPDDQKNYNSSFLNADNPRYDYITGLSGAIDKTQVSLAYYYRFPEDYGGGLSNKPPSDQELKNLFKIYTQPSVKNFSIIRKLQDDTLYDDKSYTALVGYHNPYQNDIPRDDYDFSYGFTFYTTNVVGTYVEKTYGRTMKTVGIGDSLDAPIQSSASYPIYDEYVMDTKIGINDNYVYDVSKLQTGTGGVYTKFIKINRRRSVNKDGTDTWQIQDGENTTTDIAIQPSFVPPITDVGTIKILYDNSKASIIENSYLDNATMTFSQKQRFLINPTKPYLSNPSSCPAAEFNLAVDPSIFDENLVSVYVSNQRLFINFDTKTLIFEINNALSYKPVIYIKTINSLKSYKFTYNNNGLFFSRDNEIFTYDLNSDTLILSHIIA